MPLDSRDELIDKALLFMFRSLLGHRLLVINLGADVSHVCGD